MPGLHICRSVLNPHHEATIENSFLFEHVTCWIVATMTLWHCFSWAIHQQLQQAPGPRQHIRVGARRGTLQRCSTLPWLIISDYSYRWCSISIINDTQMHDVHIPLWEKLMKLFKAIVGKQCLCESVSHSFFSGWIRVCAQPHSFHGNVASNGGWCAQFQYSFGTPYSEWLEVRIIYKHKINHRLCHGACFSIALTGLWASFHSGQHLAGMWITLPPYQDHT